MLLSFILPSYMIVPERILANTLFSFNINIKISLQESSSRITNNMEINTLRDWFTSSSANSSRSPSVLSNIFLKEYAKNMQALNNSLVWADQVENKRFQTTSLSYASVKGREDNFTNQVPNIDLNHVPK